ncbi:hypothetical protein AJ87_33810 [Rhizobium yanglingense]|nr:hypothetical protein AJ87_33810 [Rhizobium yanglingense]
MLLALTFLLRANMDEKQLGKLPELMLRPEAETIGGEPQRQRCLRFRKPDSYSTNASRDRINISIKSGTNR